MSGPVKVDETYFGGKRRNMRASQRKGLEGRGSVGKTAVVGMKDRAINTVRAKVVPNTNGVESFWSNLKRAHKGTFHKLSPKHLNRYVGEFVSKHNVRELDTLEQMATLARGMDHKRLKYQDLIASSA